jgi:cytochrome c peroxidase
MTTNPPRSATRLLAALAALALAALAAGCGSTDEVERVARTAAPAVAPGARGEINPRLLRRFAPVTRDDQAVVRSTPEIVSLGRMLWFEPRLSRDRAITCNTCHALDRYGVDGQATSLGHGGQRGRRNAPTVYNSAEHFALFWDGRAHTAEEQATGPILNPAEMAMTEPEVLVRLGAAPEYVEAFRRAFPAEPEALTLANVGRALGAFERGLVTRSRWDDYLAGHRDALTPQETQGLRVFLNVGCMGCHTGPQVGASMFQLVGAVEPWPRRDDLGRFEVTHAPTDRMVFKVPTLRNIARTAPYFHDGSCATLPVAVRTMGRHQLGVDLGDDEVDAIVAFLGAMTGDLPTAYIAAPALPR